MGVRGLPQIYIKGTMMKSSKKDLFTNQKEVDRAIQAAVDQAEKVRPVECAVCGCMPKPDEWSSRVENCCIDCG